MIMKGRTPLRLPVTGAVTLVLAAAVTLPAWASAGQQQPPPPPPVPAVVPKAPPAPPAPPTPPEAPNAKAPAPVPPRVVHTQKAPPPPPARADAPKFVVSTKDGRAYTVHLRSENLPEDARKALAQAAAEEVAIREEAERQVDARRAAMTTALEVLQDQYTKAGKLDEALAIRNYLQAASKGAPPRVIKR